MNLINSKPVVPAVRPNVTPLSRSFVCWALPLLAACATTPLATVPEALRVADRHWLAMVVPAKGVQIYECRAAQSAGARHEWVFIAPEAQLFDTRGNAIGTHGAGPFWQANDGSRTLGTVLARADAPGPGAIPWLLLAAKPAGNDGLFSKVTRIQRVNTVGGVAPAAGCTRESADVPVRVDYTAEYYFLSDR